MGDFDMDNSSIGSGSPLTTQELSIHDNSTIKRPKRKKASRACFHCQKAHLTCDDARPCGRCIKRGLDSTCQDGIRKKAKYLQDVDDEALENHQKHEGVLQPVQSANVRANHPQFSSSREPSNTSVQELDRGNSVAGDQLLLGFDFGSRAANLEYSMISTMLGGSGLTPGTEVDASPDPFHFPSPQTNPTSNYQMPTPPSHYNGLQSHNTLQYSNQTIPGLKHAESSINTSSPRSQSPASYPHSGNGLSTTSATYMQQPGYTDPHGQRPTPVARRPFTNNTNRNDATSIYKSITRPFSYTNGYHLLNTYLRTRFEKDDLLRIARAIVGYRPSFIALTKTLREEDLTFMEICFQRTLLEYEKFVGYSGTPTIIWRRTGQIEMVGKEFCLLTKWSREQLLQKQTFIMELMDDSSVVEYFEKFSAHAFGDTSSVQTTCVLMTPQKRPVPCAFCFTIKRDVFDIPMMIVGQYLPILG